MEAVLRPADRLLLGAILFVCGIVLAALQDVHAAILGGKDKVKDIDIASYLVLMLIGLILGAVGILKLIVS